MAPDPSMNNMEVRASAAATASAYLVTGGIRAFTSVPQEHADINKWEATSAMREVTAAVEYYIKNGYWKAT